MLVLVGVAMSLVGERVRHYRIEQELGRGGMGEVYVAFDETLERRVALKAIRAEHRLGPKAKARFLREARVLSKLDHPGICRIHDYLDGERADFLVLELIEGETLSKAAARLDTARKLEVAQRIAEVLVVAHAEGVVHRDLKPDNVMLTREGATKVLDFGLATRGQVSHFNIDDDGRSFPVAPEQTATIAPDASIAGSVVGTPFYMSPEQARGAPATPASDLYSLGLTLQTIFTGAGAYPRDLPGPELARRVTGGETLPIAGLDRELTALIDALKSFAPTRRPTALETVKRLRWIRERPRRRRRRLIAAGVATLVIAASVKYAVDLRHERAEADRRRAQAEDLIEFMLGDLREKLAPVGRLDVLSDVGDRALTYFASLSAAELTDDERYRLAKAMSQIGEVRMAEGDYDAAFEAFEESLGIAEALVARDPSQATWKAGLGAAYFWIGSVHYARGDLDTAEARFRDYQRVSLELVEAEPDNEAWRLEVGYAYTNLAAVRLERRDTAGALEALRASIEIKRRLAEAAPHDVERRESLANSLSWLAETLDGTGDQAEALRTVETALEIYIDLAERDPRDMEAQQKLSITHNRAAHLLERTGRDDDALRHLEADIAIARKLVAHDPNNADWRRGLAVSQSTVGRLLARRGRVDEGLALLGAARAALEELVVLEPSQLEWQLDLAQVLQSTARTEIATGHATSALERVAHSTARIASLAATSPLEFETRRIGASAAVVRGEALLALGRANEARESWLAGLQAVEALEPAQPSIDTIEMRARLLLLLGRVDEARAALETLARFGYAPSDLVALAAAHGLDHGAPP